MSPTYLSQWYHGLYWHHITPSMIIQLNVNSSHSAWVNWPPFRRRYFHMHFHEWKVLYFDFVEVCSYVFNWQLTSIGSDNGLAPNRGQAIIWINANPVHWQIYAALGADEWKDCSKNIPPISNIFIWQLYKCSTLMRIMQPAVEKYWCFKLIKHNSVCIWHIYISVHNVLHFNYYPVIFTKEAAKYCSLMWLCPQSDTILPRAWFDCFIYYFPLQSLCWSNGNSIKRCHLSVPKILV